MGLYLGSSVFLILFLALSFYHYEKATVIAMNKERLKSSAQKISSQIIYSFMHAMPLEITRSDEFEVALYDKNRELISGNPMKVALEEGFYADSTYDYYVDMSAQLHHGVKFVVLKSRNADKEINRLILRVLAITIFSVGLIALVGYFLSKMFLKPIYNERIKLDKFIKDTTHELNTPISAILLSIERLKREPIEQKILQRVELSSKRLQKIYADLTYLLLDQQSHEVKMINLKELLLQELLLYEELANKKEITITRHLQDAFMEMDETSAQRLLDNLLSNAIKYNRQNGTIDLVLTPTSLSITDSGIGIAPQDKERLFERFFRANDHEGGFGVGLDIVKRICDTYGITIAIESEENRFTRIRLSF